MRLSVKRALARSNASIATPSTTLPARLPKPTGGGRQQREQQGRDQDGVRRVRPDAGMPARRIPSRGRERSAKRERRTDGERRQRDADQRAPRGGCLGRDVERADGQQAPPDLALDLHGRVFDVDRPAERGDRPGAPEAERDDDRMAGVGHPGAASCPPGDDDDGAEQRRERRTPASARTSRRWKAAARDTQRRRTVAN